MVDVILFHHAQGLTDGVRAFADRLRAGGHRVEVPDLYEGQTFPTVDSGVEHAQKFVGQDVLGERAQQAAAGMPDACVYAGISMGAMHAHSLATSRPGALAAVLYEGHVPPRWMESPWPEGLALQVHLHDQDDWADAELASESADGFDGAEVYLYPGDTHLFTDASLEQYDADQTDLVVERTLALLSRWG